MDDQVAAPGAKVVRHESVLGSWEYAIAKPHASLQPHVREYYGWIERMAQPVCRREVPTDEVPIIINFGTPFRLFDQADPSRWTEFGSFTTGAYDSYVLVGSTGPSAGIQVNLSIFGARLFLGRPLRDMKNRVVELEDLFGRAARLLTQELYDAPSWDARFEILDRELARRILNTRAPSPAVSCAWSRLVSSGGRASIGGIVEGGRLQSEAPDRAVPRRDRPVAQDARARPALRPRRPDHQGGRRRQARRDRAGLRLLRPGAFLPRLPRVCRRDPHRAHREPDTRPRRLLGRRVNFVQDRTPATR